MAMSSLKPCPRSKMLSDDVIYEIILQLPVKSLLRFKSVCKQWCSMVSNPCFIETHLAIQSRRDDVTLIVQKTVPPECHDSVSVSLVNLGSRQLDDDVLRFPYSESEYSFVPCISIVGCVKGIVCFSVCTAYLCYISVFTPRYIYLWNPATKQSKLVRNTHNNIMTEWSYGFGFDSVDNDFKVVKVVGLSLAAEVYSAKLNVWRPVGQLPVIKDHPDNMNQLSIFVGGFLCWIGTKGIIAYDLSKDALNCGIKFPGIVGLASIIDFYDSIAMIVWNDQRSSNINLWTLDDADSLRAGGVEASWTLMLKIDSDRPDQFACSDCTSGYFLLMTNGNRHKKEVKKVLVPFSWRNILKYTESLVSIPGSKQVNLNANADDN